jgi:hypothetical protein
MRSHCNGSTFLQHPSTLLPSESIQGWAVTIAAFTTGIGALATSYYQYRHVSRRTENQWMYSVIFFVFLILTLITGFVDFWNLANPIFSFLTSKVMGPLGAGMYSSLGFWILSAGYRAIRIRTIESTFLMLAAVLVMLGNAPVGAVIWSGFPTIGSWILDVPANAGVRAVLIGAGIAGIMLAVRIIGGYERNYLGAG